MSNGIQVCRDAQILNLCLLQYVYMSLRVHYNFSPVTALPQDLVRVTALFYTVFLYTHGVITQVHITRKSGQTLSLTKLDPPVAIFEKRNFWKTLIYLPSNRQHDLYSWIIPVPCIQVLKLYELPNDFCFSGSLETTNSYGFFVFTIQQQHCTYLLLFYLNFSLDFSLYFVEGVYFYHLFMYISIFFLHQCSEKFYVIISYRHHRHILPFLYNKRKRHDDI